MRARDVGEGRERPGGEPGRRRPIPGGIVPRPAPPLDLPAPVVALPALPTVVELGRVPAGPGLAAVVAALASDEAVFEA